MVSPALSAFSTLLKMGAGNTVPGPETFTTVAEVRTISGPGFTLDTTDVTSHDSTDGFEEILPTILRTGPVTLEVNYVPTDATHNSSTGFLSKFLGKTKTNFKLIFPNAILEADRSYWAFAAYVVGMSPTANHDGALTGSVTLKMVGTLTEWHKP